MPNLEHSYIMNIVLPHENENIYSGPYSEPNTSIRLHICITIPEARPWWAILHSTALSRANSVCWPNVHAYIRYIYRERVDMRWQIDILIHKGQSYIYIYRPTSRGKFLSWWSFNNFMRWNYIDLTVICSKHTRTLSVTRHNLMYDIASSSSS